ncbi:MAG TPA: DUF928 domain-containing protein [Nostocaceae cyanobacterium]|nr:DUF928 domain-containing protein [Nostocaceae cyanobacterium]
MQRKFNFNLFALSFLCSFLALPKLAYSLDISYPPHRDAATADSALQKTIQRLRRQPETAGGSCIKSGMTALVPKKQIGLTDANSITFLVYVPENRYSSNQKYSAELSLLDNQDNLIYQNRFKLTGNPGIIALELPFNKIKSSNNVDLVELNKLYQWEFTVICDDIDYSSNPSAGGFFKKVKFERNYGPFVNAPPLPIYWVGLNFSYGFWYQGISSLVSAKDRYPKNKELTEEWIEVLKEEGLEHLAKAKLIYCCTLEENTPSPTTENKQHPSLPPQRVGRKG